MDANLMSEIISDIIEASQRPTMAGKAGRERRGYIVVDDEVIQALLYAKKELVCKFTVFGNYDCYVSTKYGFDVDACVVAEINGLNTLGITTIGCCCGHARAQGFIQVTPSHCEKMTELGYEQLPTKSDNSGTWCFKPKTILPKADSLASMMKNES